MVLEELIFCIENVHLAFGSKWIRVLFALHYIFCVALFADMKRKKRSIIKLV